MKNLNPFEFLNKNKPPLLLVIGMLFIISAGQPEMKEAALYDRGLHMQMGTILLPNEWQLYHNIAMNPYTGMYNCYLTDIIGTEGQFIRSLNNVSYSEMPGQSFEQQWRWTVKYGISDQLRNIELGRLQYSPHLERSVVFREYLREIQQQGMNLEPLEADIFGTVNGEEFKGIVYIARLTVPTMPGVGIFSTRIVISPAGLVAETLDLDEFIFDSYKKNPVYDQTIRAIQQQVMYNFQNVQYPYQMAQPKIQGSYDDYNRWWNEQFFGSWDTGSSSTGSSYTVNDRFLDTITGYSTFDDPYTGQQKKAEGHYTYNFTDGYGNYYGTDDPLFDPRDLQGGYWYPIDPLGY